MTPSPSARLVTPRFVLVVSCGLFYFLALTMLQPVLPRYVRDDLGRGDLAVGVAVGALAFGAIVLRLWAGRLGDTSGRRILMVGGGSKNRLLCAATAREAGVPVVSFALEGTAVGNIARQLISLRAVKDLPTFRHLLGAGLKQKTYAP